MDLCIPFQAATVSLDAAEMTTGDITLHHLIPKRIDRL